MPTPLDPLLEQLQAASLMTADESRAWLYRQPPQRRPVDPQGMAEMLVQSGKLTRYQGDELLAGRGRKLAFGDYTLEERLGIGAMGQVFRARHRKMNRVVALKVLQPAMSHSPEMIARFHREVQAAARLIHPNIVAALDASEQDGQHYLVMEYVEGCDLANLMKRSGALPMRLALDYILQAARGLEHAHAEGIVHRDIKPGNLLLDKRGIVKILDLGAARMENVWGEQIPDEDDGLTHTGNILGTVDYMAPEQALNLRRADTRADIYSLGCTLYRLLTNQRMYAGETVLERILAHREEPVPRLQDTCPEAPESLEAAFQRMVAKLPEDRYASIVDLIHDLELVIDELPADVKPEPPATLENTASEALVDETAETVWGDSPAQVEASGTPDEDHSVEAQVESSATGTAVAVATAPEVATGPRVMSKPLPTANWVLPLVAAVVLLPLLLVALVPGSPTISSGPTSELDRIRKQERWTADPQYSERALERMRREFEQFRHDWQLALQQNQQLTLRQRDELAREGDLHPPVNLSPASALDGLLSPADVR